MIRRIFDAGAHSGAASFGLLCLRVGAGAMLVAGHGWGKLLAFGTKAATFPDPLGIGHRLSLASTIGAEFVAAGLVVIGLATRPAALGVVFTMAVAAFVVNAGEPWSGKELAAIYLVAFLPLVFTGAGRYSLDGKIAGGRRSR